MSKQIPHSHRGSLKNTPNVRGKKGIMGSMEEDRKCRQLYLCLYGEDKRCRSRVLEFLSACFCVYACLIFLSGLNPFRVNSGHK